MKSIFFDLSPPPSPPVTHSPLQFSHHSLSIPQTLSFLSPKPLSSPLILLPNPTSSNSPRNRLSSPSTESQDDGIPVDLVKILAKFKSRYNYIRVLEVSRKADHPFRGSRLLLLDDPGNIHSINFLFRTLTDTYFDVFATLPPILPPGPIGILGFGAGSAAKLMLELYPEVVVHGWEIDPAVIDVGRKYFELERIEKQHNNRIFIYIGNALDATLRDGFSGIVVDLFSKGSLIPELQNPFTWIKMKNRLKKDGRIMVNVGGSCVESEDSKRDGKIIMQDTLKAMYEVFPNQLHVLNLGNRKDDSSLVLTGIFPDSSKWKKAMPKSLRGFVDMWTSFDG